MNRTGTDEPWPDGDASMAEDAPELCEAPARRLDMRPSVKPAQREVRDPWAFPSRQRALPLPIEEQLTLDLPGPALGLDAEPVESAANRQAMRLTAAPELWPMGAACLSGPKGCGKTLILASRFADARRLQAEDFSQSALRDDLVAPGGRLVFEDLDRAFETAPPSMRAGLESAMFHLLNMVAQRDARLVVSGRTPPARWSVALPDLRTRLAALPLARIEAPDDAHLTAALRDGFARCGATIDDRTLDYLTTHMERSFDTVGRIVARVDALSRRERAPIDRRLVARALRWRF